MKTKNANSLHSQDYVKKKKTVKKGGKVLEKKKKKEPLSAERSATFASARLESPGAATYKSGSKATITIANRRKKDHQTVSPSVQQARLMFFVSYYTSPVSYAVKISPCFREPLWTSYSQLSPTRN